MPIVCTCKIFNRDFAGQNFPGLTNPNFKEFLKSFRVLISKTGSKILIFYSQFYSALVPVPFLFLPQKGLRFWFHFQFFRKFGAGCSISSKTWVQDSNTSKIRFSLKILRTGFSFLLPSSFFLIKRKLVFFSFPFF